MGYLLYSTVFALLVLSTGMLPFPVRYGPPISLFPFISLTNYSPLPNPPPLDTPHAVPLHLPALGPPLLDPLAILPFLLPRIIISLLPPPFLLQFRYRIRLLLFRLRPFSKCRRWRLSRRSRYRQQEGDPTYYEEQESQLRRSETYLHRRKICEEWDRTRRKAEGSEIC